MRIIRSIRLTHIMLGFLGSLILGLMLIAAQSSGAVSSNNSGRIAFQEEKPLFGFASAEYRVDEGVTIAIEVELSAQSNTTATVQYQTLDGTAKSGTDYKSAAGVLTFPPSSTSQTFLVETIQNNTYLGDRFLNLLLTNPSADGIGVGGIGVGVGGLGWPPPDDGGLVAVGNGVGVATVSTQTTS